MTSFLNRLRKQEILLLSREAGLELAEETRKDDLVEALDKHLSENAPRLSKVSAFEHYYSTRRTPHVPRTSSANPRNAADDKALAKSRGRRTTKVKGEPEEPDSPTITVTQHAIEPPALEPSPVPVAAPASVALTPVPVRRRSEHLPASPADVAEDVEIAAERISTGISHYYQSSGIPSAIEDMRQAFSSVEAVQATILLVEFTALLWHTIPFQYAFDLPPLHLGFFDIPPIAVSLPDLFMLLTGQFWRTTLLWSTTNLLAPLGAAYFCNLSTRDVKRHGSRVTLWRHVYDPLVFSVAKALLTYSIYAQRGFATVLFDRDTVDIVDQIMVGGHSGVLIGCGIGALVSLYEAAQRK